MNSDTPTTPREILRSLSHSLSRFVRQIGRLRAQRLLPSLRFLDFSFLLWYSKAIEFFTA